MNTAIISIIVSICTGIIGAVVFFRNKRNRQNKAFSILAFVSTIWILVNLFGGSTYVSENFSKALIRLDYIIGVALVASFYFFTVTMNSSNEKSRKLHKYIYGFLLLAALTALSDMSISLNYIGNDFEIIEGPLYLVYAGAIISSLSAGIYNLIHSYKNSWGVKRAQVSVMLAGLSLSAIVIILPNIIFPLLYESSVVEQSADILTPLGYLIFISSTAYSIIKHKLFDIRFIVARTLSYFLSLISLASLYGLLAFGFLQQFFSDQSVSPEQRFSYIVLAVILALTFQPLKQFFDSITRNIFYRDGYGTQSKLKFLGEILAEQIDMEIIVEKVTSLLSDTLKPTYAQLIVLEKSKVFYMHSTDDRKEHPSISGLSKLNQTVNLYDDSSGSKKLFRKNGIDLITKIETQGELIGFLVFGPKASGSIYTSQDIELLTIASKELAIALENAKNFAEIEQFNETLKKKIKTATNNLRKKNAKLRELDQAKDDFISMASHQLRTPLTTIKGYLSMLSDGDFGDLSNKQQEVTDLAFASSERMVYLISDLLNVSRIDTGKFMIEPSEVDLVEIVQEEVDQLQRTAKAKGLKLNTKFPNDFPLVMLDINKTRQVMMNFIDNAIYYTPEGEVTVELKADKDSVSFEVTDTGIGVPEDAKGELFTKFFRAENARKTRPDGTGLGLFMAKKVITAQGGSIIFRSQEGEGSTFGFRFALANVRAKKSTAQD